MRRSMLAMGGCALALVAGAALWFGSSPGLDDVRLGMTTHEVYEILGGPDGAQRDKFRAYGQYDSHLYGDEAWLYRRFDMPVYFLSGHVSSIGQPDLPYMDVLPTRFYGGDGYTYTEEEFRSGAAPPLPLDFFAPLPTN